MKKELLDYLIHIFIIDRYEFENKKEHSLKNYSNEEITEIKISILAEISRDIKTLKNIVLFVFITAIIIGILSLVLR